MDQRDKGLAPKISYYSHRTNKQKEMSFKNTGQPKS